MRGNTLDSTRCESFSPSGVTGCERLRSGMGGCLGGPCFQNRVKRRYLDSIQYQTNTLYRLPSGPSSNFLPGARGRFGQEDLPESWPYKGEGWNSHLQIACSKPCEILFTLLVGLQHAPTISSGSVVRPPWHPPQPPSKRRWARVTSLFRVACWVGTTKASLDRLISHLILPLDRWIFRSLPSYHPRPTPAEFRSWSRPPRLR